MRILLATLGVMVAAAAPAFAAPVPDFTVIPNPPIAGEPATFTSTSTVDPGQGFALVAWDFESDGTTDGSSMLPPFTAVFTYPDAGSKTLKMVVTDDTAPIALESTRFFPITVNARPVAQFSFTPAAPVIGQEVLFQSFSYDPGGSGLTYAWDTDGDGFDDGTGATASRSFTAPGAKQVALRVTDSNGVSAVSGQQVTIGPAPASPLPVAQFAVTPARPEVGEQVSLRSFSYDSDGTIASQRWDLDGDGDFDENVTGKTAFTVFSKAGERIARLEVRDSSGGVQTETQNVNVTRPPTPGLALINPFPVARLAGSVYPRGVRVRLLEVRTPPRSRVVVRCSGRSCPDKEITKTSKRKPVRFKSMSRFLRAGTVLKVSIRRSGQIGKYTRWTIRGGKLPKRKDLCLYPGKSKGRRCPAS